MGIEGNELADHLARQGLQKNIKHKNHFITHSYIKQAIKVYLMKAWKRIWISETIREEEGKKARGLGKFYRTQARQMIPRITWKPANLSHFSRSTQSAYCQVRTGVGNILSHLFIIGKSETSICNFCQRKRQTVSHLLLECRFFKEEREKTVDHGIIPSSQTW